MVEFLGATLLLLLPLVYLVVTVGRVQAATFAAEQAASGAARVFVTSPDERTGTRLALAATRLAFADQHVAGAGPSALTVTCPADGCGRPGSTVLTHVRVDVPLPGAPRFLQGHVPLHVVVVADGTGTFDRYADLSGWG
ncbi:hypothetical protein CLV34_0390 [Luteimicrobium subarcticum]|uniref:TadE-like protein n=1 Tax=Luteimicrobium subarcticum TaxID=620910 RepID=A0A2M8WUL0_9MICO|nr:hypothetical protein CLV34_0390 [Luteimicrobium subarcticum]